MRTLHKPVIPLLVAVALGGGVLASASEASADASAAGSPVRESAADERIDTARGTITFRTERYTLSHRAVVSTSANKIRITDPAAINEQGNHAASLLVELGYTRDPLAPTMLRVSSGIAIRGYDFATGTYDEGQAIRLGSGSLAIDLSNQLDRTRVVGHLGSPTERGIDLDVTGLPFR